MSISEAYIHHLIAACWFVLCWAGYTRYAHAKGRTTPCLASVLHLSVSYTHLTLPTNREV